MLYRNLNPNPVPNVGARQSDITPEENDRMPLTAPVPGLTFDISALVEDCLRVVRDYPVTWGGLATERYPQRLFGGWSITNETGDYRDGWTQKGWREGQFHTDWAYAAGWRPKWFHTRPTELCRGSFLTVWETLDRWGLTPRGLRIWTSEPGHHVGPHTDGPDDLYSLRLHIPLITNPDSSHTWYTDQGAVTLHTPADGRAHYFRTNILHDVHNRGTEPRYHLIADVWDTQGLVKEYHYPQDRLARLDSYYQAHYQYYMRLIQDPKYAK